MGVVSAKPEACTWSRRTNFVRKGGFPVVKRVLRPYRWPRHCWALNPQKQHQQHCCDVAVRRGQVVSVLKADARLQSLRPGSGARFIARKILFCHLQLAWSMGIASYFVTLDGRWTIGDQTSWGKEALSCSNGQIKTVPKAQALLSLNRNIAMVYSLVVRARGFKYGGSNPKAGYLMLTAEVKLRWWEGVIASNLVISDCAAWLSELDIVYNNTIYPGRMIRCFLSNKTSSSILAWIRNQLWQVNFEISVQHQSSLRLKLLFIRQTATSPAENLLCSTIGCAVENTEVPIVYHITLKNSN